MAVQPRFSEWNCEVDDDDGGAAAMVTMSIATVPVSAIACNYGKYMMVVHFFFICCFFVFLFFRSDKIIKSYYTII